MLCWFVRDYSSFFPFVVEASIWTGVVGESSRCIGWVVGFGGGKRHRDYRVRDGRSRRKKEERRRGGERRARRVGTGDSFVGWAGQGPRPLAGGWARTVAQWTESPPQEAQHGQPGWTRMQVNRGGRRRKTITYHRARYCVSCKRTAPFPSYCAAW